MIHGNSILSNYVFHFKKILFTFIIMSIQRDNASCLDSLEKFLEHSLEPLILDGILSIREQAREISVQNNNEMDETDITVQLLRDVKNWTQILLDEEVKRILTKIPFLQKLLTALFVMKVKVLSVINMRKDTEDFPLTIPANTTFIHHVYIQCANILVDNKQVLQDMNLVDLSPLVNQGVKNACLACIEWSDLLSWGLDGVNVNDVINNIMKEDENTNVTRNTEENLDDDDDDDANEDDFTHMANESKMNENDDKMNENYDKINDNEEDLGKKEGDEQSFFDYSENDENESNNNESDHKIRDDTSNDDKSNISINSQTNEDPYSSNDNESVSQTNSQVSPNSNQPSLQPSFF